MVFEYAKFQLKDKLIADRIKKLRKIYKINLNLTALKYYGLIYINQELTDEQLVNLIKNNQDLNRYRLDRDRKK